MAYEDNRRMFGERAQQASLGMVKRKIWEVIPTRYALNTNGTSVPLQRSDSTGMYTSLMANARPANNTINGYSNTQINPVRIRLNYQLAAPNNNAPESESVNLVIVGQFKGEGPGEGAPSAMNREAILTALFSKVLALGSPLNDQAPQFYEQVNIYHRELMHIGTGVKASELREVEVTIDEQYMGPIIANNNLPTRWYPMRNDLFIAWIGGRSAGEAQNAQLIFFSEVTYY